ncbi:hypothetical protein COCNU_05G003760 [Cocos nucifera]|uniref:Uncharacterized protein n=1 Tax=Cocos nucifera TaxID=13894 RepID=A0A8K0N155_COCNU|nr:hypothetical protein COCNU_05G003760 [Cocos nucifera]
MILLSSMVGKGGFYYFSYFGRGLEFYRLGEPQEVLLKDPPLDQCLKQDLEALHGFEFFELKELLFEQTLFNIGLSQLSPEGKNLSPSKVLGPKTFQNTKVETIGSRFMENTIDLLTKATRFELEASMLKAAKDKLSKVVGEASEKVNAAKRKVQDVEAVLMRSTKENAQLLGINKALEVEIEELKARSINAEAFEAEALKMAEEKMAMLMSDMEARAEVVISKAISRVVDNFQALEEFKDEKALFALDAYDEAKRVVRVRWLPSIWD